MAPRDIIAWLAEGRAILAAECGVRPGAVRLLIAYADTGRGLEFILPPDEGEDRYAPTTPPEPRRYRIEPDTSLPLVTDPAGLLMRTVHRRLLAASTADPETAERVCRRAGMRCNSYTRTALTELVRFRALLHTPDGYCLPPVAPAASP